MMGAYMGLTFDDAAEMTFDQFYAACCPEDDLKRTRGGGRVVRGTPDELAAKGLIPPQPRETVLERMARKQKRKRRRDGKKARSSTG